MSDEEIEKTIFQELEEKKKNILSKRKGKEEELEAYKVKSNFYVSPVKQYLKYKKKKAQYKKLHHENKLKYHLTIHREVIWKYFRKKMLWKLVSAVGFSTVMYFFYSSNLKNKIVDIFKFSYGKFKSLFSRQ